MDYKVGDRIEYGGEKATIIGYSGKDSKKHFQIEYDNFVATLGHNGDSILYDNNGIKIKVGEGKGNRWNLESNNRDITKLIDTVEISDDISTKIIDQTSSEFIKQGITRI